MRRCTHLASLVAKEPNTIGCEECLKMGAKWVHLRLCLECGHVGCCDDSPNRHATKHFHTTKHAVIKSFEPEENWGYCYVDDVEFDPESDAAFASIIEKIKHPSYR